METRRLIETCLKKPPCQTVFMVGNHWPLIRPHMELVCMQGGVVGGWSQCPLNIKSIIQGSSLILKIHSCLHIFKSKVERKPLESFVLADKFLLNYPGRQRILIATIGEINPITESQKKKQARRDRWKSSSPAPCLGHDHPCVMY